MKPSIAVLLLALTPLALAENAGRKGWGETAEAQFMTREERSEWESLKTDEEASRFVDRFRARHTSDFAEEVRRRAEIVDRRMPLGEVPTSRTLRGRIVLLLGAPAGLTMRAFPPPAPGSVGHPLDTRRGGASDQARIRETAIAGAGGRVEYTLRYGPNAGPGIGAEGWTVVVEADAVSGKDRLRNRRDRKKTEEILEAAARASLRAAQP